MGARKRDVAMLRSWGEDGLTRDVGTLTVVGALDTDRSLLGMPAPLPLTSPRKLEGAEE